MRIIITGGSGLIGRALTDDLTGSGHEVIILSRSPQGVQNLPEGARAVGWDGSSAEGWGHLADGADVIINLAGASLAGETPLQMRWTPARKKVIVDSRVNAGKAVVAAIAAANDRPKVLVQASAVGYYGPLDDRPVAEDHPPGTDFQSKVCVQWEEATKAVETMGVRRVVLRLGVVLDANNPAVFWLALPFRMFIGGPLGNGKQYFPWIHLGDVVSAVNHLIQKPDAKGVYNLTAPGVVTNRTLAKAIGRVLKRPALIPVPAFAMRLLFGKTATILLDGQNAIPQHLQQEGFAFQYPQIEPALQDVLG